MKNTKIGLRAARRAGAVALALATATVLAACSSGGSTTDNGSSNGDSDAAETVDLRVLMAPINYEVAHIALNEGYFAEQNLNVELLDGGTAQDNMAQLAGGSADISILSWDATVTATAQGVPVTLIGGNAIVSDEFDTSGVFVRADSGITDIAELKGKTVAFNSLGTGGNVPVFQALEEAGVAADEITAVAIPYASMQAALEQDQVDAVLAADSFFAQINSNDDYVAISHPVREFRAGLGITLWGVDDAWLAENEEVAERFLAAIDQAITWYEDEANLDAILELRAEVTGQPVENVSKLMVPFTTAVNVEVSQSVTDALEAFGLVTSPKTVDEIVWSGAPRV